MESITSPCTGVALTLLSEMLQLRCPMRHDSSNRECSDLILQCPQDSDQNEASNDDVHRASDSSKDPAEN